jgi:hypothetical protein
LTSARVQLSILWTASRVSPDTPGFIPSTMRFLTLLARAGELHLESRLVERRILRFSSARDDWRKVVDEVREDRIRFLDYVLFIL